ncbi:MAG: C39 family peptidase, partial [Chthoniobacterales bacterium]
MRLLLLSFALVFLPPVLKAEPTFEQINTACGAPLFADENLWDDDASAVAERLKLPEESRTSDQSSFRSYPAAEARFLGARPYSQSLLADGGRPSGLSMVFANKGDSVAEAVSVPDNRSVTARRGELRDNREAIEADAQRLEQALTAAFGKPGAGKLGAGRETREKVLRWDWRGHAFLLAAPRGEYVALRVLPAETADSGGKSRIPDSEMKLRLASRVERRANGDVVLRDIPMVDQGPKGYCVPATWERVMRYMGIPADMYVLAMAGGTRAGGGTSTADIAWAVKSAVTGAGRRMEGATIKLTPEGVAKYIDEGLPVMWAMFSTTEFNAAADGRMGPRKAMTDPESWSASLDLARKAAKKMRPDRESGHVCMIIGYTAKTGELAVSDSWGPQFAERWITAEEARVVSQN